MSLGILLRFIDNNGLITETKLVYVKIYLDLRRIAVKVLYTVIPRIMSYGIKRFF